MVLTVFRWISGERAGYFLGVAGAGFGSMNGLELIVDDTRAAPPGPEDVIVTLMSAIRTSPPFLYPQMYHIQDGPAKVAVVGE